MGATRAALATILALAGPAGPAGGAGDRAGDFDHYVLALSWTPSWCAAEGAARGAERCGRAGQGWTLHGLWPQHEEGWPSDCATAHAPPTRRRTAAEADLFGSGGAAWHQWRKHGTCSGLAADAYFAAARRAFDAVVRPPLLRELGRDVTLPAWVVEAAFLDADPRLAADGVTVTCRDRRIAEVRICLTRYDLAPRRCGADARRDCTLDDAALPAVR